jgi:hypothetical protein
LTSPEPTETDFTLGVQVGVSRYGNDKNLPTQFTKVANGLETANLYPDVFINPIDNLNLDLSNYPNSRYLVLGFGSDLYLKPSLADSKSHLATTLVPAVGDNLMSIISSDLEGDFVGGIPGVIKLTFGNQGFDFTAEHDVNISQAKLDEVARVASDYETRIQ